MRPTQEADGNVADTPDADTPPTPFQAHLRSKSAKEPSTPAPNPPAAKEARGQAASPICSPFAQEKGRCPSTTPLYIISLFLAETGNFTPFSAKNNSLLLLIMSSDILAVRVVVMDGGGTQDTGQHQFRNILLQCTRLVLYAYHFQNLLSSTRHLIAEL